MPRGLFLPLGLGMYTLRAGLGINFPLLILEPVLTNHALSIPSKVSLSDPFVMFPGLLFIIS